MLFSSERHVINIVFGYFSQGVTDYTPIDIGYIAATLNNSQSQWVDYRIQRLTHRRNYSGTNKEQLAERRNTISGDVREVLKSSPDAVFIFVDSVTWSKVFALGRAIAIARQIRAVRPKTFIGVCSYKIEAFQGQVLVDDGTFDCVVIGDGERAFSHLERILAKKQLTGVLYSKNTPPSEPFSTAPAPLKSRELDHIPSPYLNRVFDEFLAIQQKKRNGRFMAFLTSARGCHFDCYYCSRSVKFEKVRYFSPTRFYDEIEYLYKRFGIFRFFVLDDAFLLSKRRLQELKDEFLKRCAANPGLRSITFFVMARPESIDRDVVQYMADLQVKVLQIGLQTINPDIQHYMGRPIDVDKFREIKGWLDEFKISLQLDVILGLPNDTVEWMNKTLEYTTSLNPLRIQLKQFYLNPFTLFHVDKDKYGIVTDSDRDIFDYDFDAPYVVRADGIDDNYFEETSKFIRYQIQKYPHIHWKYLSRKERFVSQAYYPRAKSNIARWAPLPLDRVGAN